MGKLVKNCEKKHTSLFEKNHALIMETYMDLLAEKKGKRLPTQSEVAERCGLTRECVIAHQKEFDWDKYKTSVNIFTTDLIKNIIILSRKSASAQRLLAEIFGIIDTKYDKPNINIMVSLPENLIDD